MKALKASLNILLAWHFEIFQTSLNTSDLTYAMCLFSLPFHTLKMNKNANASFCVHLLYLIKNLKIKSCIRFLITLSSLFPGFCQNCLDILHFYFLLVALFRCWVPKPCCCYTLCLKLVKFRSDKEETFKKLLLCCWHVCQIADCVCFLCRITSPYSAGISSVTSWDTVDYCNTTPRHLPLHPNTWLCTPNTILLASSSSAAGCTLLWGTSAG